jgi:hypothetical protein
MAGPRRSGNIETVRPLLRRSRSAFLVIGLLGSTAAACIASAPTGLHRQVDDGADAGAGGGEATFVDASTGPEDAGQPDVAPPDPHAVIGADPSHGPFNGGQRVLVRGKGFAGKVRVWFGDTEADPSTLVAIDAARVQIAAPPGKAGAVDLGVQNGDDVSTRRTLVGGYAYDALYAAPSEGPVAGGTVIEIVGQGTHWDATTVAKIDQKPCTTLKVESPTLLSCTVPKGTPGSKTVSVTTGKEAIVVLDAYTYQDSQNGFKGGLSGADLAGKLTVLVYDDYTGDPIQGATAIVGTDPATAIVRQADGSGVIQIADASLTGPKTVTVAATCHQPITFVAEPVDTVTAYLDPIMDPSCGQGGDPPPVGYKPSDQGIITGEITWGSGVEFNKAPWTNVPPPKGPNEKQTAYVFVASDDPTAPFQVPSAGAQAPITPATPGERGYAFQTTAYAGNRSLYAVAGVEDDSVTPPLFTAYAFGVVRGLPVLPGQSLDSVYIPMTKTLDQTLTWQVTSPPPGPNGPDRLRATVAIKLGNDGYALLPGAQKQPLLPVGATLPFVGVPSLDGDLVGAAYISTARAVTGPSFQAPMSVVGSMLGNTTAQPVIVDGFVGIPTLVTPAANAAWDGRHLSTTFAKGAPHDLVVYDVGTGNGLVHWTVAAPAGVSDVELPDLSGLDRAGPRSGPVLVGVLGGRIDGFDYKKLRYRDLRYQNMTAYALDYFNAHY